MSGISKNILSVTARGARRGAELLRLADGASFLRSHQRSGRMLSALAVAAVTVTAVSNILSVKADLIASSDRATLAPAERQDSSGALLVHKKLMQVRTSRSGVPVLQFVECRHFSKDRRKLIQTGFTASGAPVLQFVSGDYCIFTGAQMILQNSAAGKADPEPLPNGQTGASNIVARPNRSPAGIFEPTVTVYQQYTCEKFGAACRTALAVQAAENPKGTCEAYRYNSDGSLNWGYFQINSAHLTRRGVNLRDMLDCRANIDFAYQLYREEGFEPWNVYRGGEYRKFLTEPWRHLVSDAKSRRTPEHLLVAGIDLF